MAGSRILRTLREMEEEFLRQGWTRECEGNITRFTRPLELGTIEKLGAPLVSEGRVFGYQGMLSGVFRRIKRLLVAQCVWAGRHAHSVCRTSPYQAKA